MFSPQKRRRMHHRLHAMHTQCTHNAHILVLQRTRGWRGDEARANADSRLQVGARIRVFRPSKLQWKSVAWNDDRGSSELTDNILIGRCVTLFVPFACLFVCIPTGKPLCFESPFQWFHFLFTFFLNLVCGITRHLRLPVLKQSWPSRNLATDGRDVSATWRNK
jgi:hypothetical protein